MDGRSPPADGAAGSRQVEPRHAVLRPAVAADVTAIAGIERTAFSDPWSAAGFRSLLDAPATRFTVAELDGRVAGYSVVIQAGDEAELANIAVDESARRRGVGRVLLTAALAEAARSGVQAMYLEVRASNVAAQALYEALGFTPAGRRRGYYQRPDEDALVLVWRADRAVSPQGGISVRPAIER